MVTPEAILKNLIIKALDYAAEVPYEDFLRAYIKALNKSVTADGLLSLNRHIFTTPDQQFYYDISTFLMEGWDKNCNLYIDIYISFFKKQYLSTYNEAIQVPEKDLLKYLDKCVEEVKDQHALYSKSVFKYLVFLYQYKDNSVLRDYLESFYQDSEKDFISDRDHNRKFIGLFFTDEVYKKYINQCRKLLAGFYGIKESKLSTTIYKEIIKGIESEGTNFSKGPYYSFIQTLIANNSGSSMWYDFSLTEYNKADCFKKLKYYPNIDLIIESYYQSALLMCFSKVKDYTDQRKIEDSDWAFRNFIEYIIGDTETKEFKKGLTEYEPSTWAKWIVEENDCREICDMAGYDVVYHIFNYTLKELYEEKIKAFFAKEKPVQGTDGQKKLEKLNADLEQLRKERDFLISENHQLNTKLNKKTSDLKRFVENYYLYIGNVELEYQEYIKNDPYYDPAEAKYQEEQEHIYIDEMEQLQNRLKDCENLIKNLLPAEAEPESEPVAEVDIAKLYEYRFLFIGDLTISGYNDLKFRFPKSVFMENATTNISNIKVDYIVLMTKAMGHSMYYKLQSTAALNNVPRIFYNGKNFESLLNVMYHQIFE